MYRITLREARLNCRMEMKEVSEKTGIPVRTLKRWEIDSGRANLVSVYKLLALYGFASLNHIHFGSESELLAQRQAALANIQEPA
ncbi:helix-turn-helix transcriptional regulator [Brevibacillus porteri]|uniref:XRE family transcriptional regulator n=1 Tax=Brevibacillus porteri TaxID=2126350 RepID=A0ABX5FG40_9BACL|nr:helix-turn-helix transcriptional regulator [Brevibacillus porteri]MED1802071.1 helix-turn-helix transcriptional regulator [Brevibacillus porteri]MED2133162.1 helix-turn-helix transcriptional regulator [Brevibacillus porteri]MED2748443.1 helix-turn-helix transcriptional regulator [Brevibacillus porteri]MED2813343.1 helix-turn-helix transcriptional regulator [Brevibacillus porteri]MED4899530.1 helix-turn-helix transcriptional regulator [Brevibacillus porteri]